MAAQEHPHRPFAILFISAVDLGSFTRAGHQVGRTNRPAISLQICRLEEVVDVKLFQRDAHRLQLTPEGKSLAQMPAASWR